MSSTNDDFLESRLGRKIIFYLESYKVLINYAFYNVTTEKGNCASLQLKQYLDDFRNNIKDPKKLTAISLGELLKDFELYITDIESKIIELVEAKTDVKDSFKEQVNFAVQYVIYDLIKHVNKILPLGDMNGGASPDYSDEEEKEAYMMATHVNYSLPCDYNRVCELLEILVKDQEEDEEDDDDEQERNEAYLFIRQLNAYQVVRSQIQISEKLVLLKEAIISLNTTNIPTTTKTTSLALQKPPLARLSIFREKTLSVQQEHGIHKSRPQEQPEKKQVCSKDVLPQLQESFRP